MYMTLYSNAVIKEIDLDRIKNDLFSNPNFDHLGLLKNIYNLELDRETDFYPNYVIKTTKETNLVGPVYDGIKNLTKYLKRLPCYLVLFDTDNGVCFKIVITTRGIDRVPVNFGNIGITAEFLNDIPDIITGELPSIKLKIFLSYMINTMREEAKWEMRDKFEAILKELINE